MNVAFHFDADNIQSEYGIPYNLPILEKFFQTLLKSNFKNLHLKIFTGDLLVYELVNDKTDEETMAKVIDGILGTRFRTWRNINPEQLVEAIFSVRIYVVTIEGLNTLVRDHLMKIFQTEISFLGAVQVYLGNPVQWTLYRHYLSPNYRYVDQELRLLYTLSNEEDKDAELEKHWKKFPFKAVKWEDLGAHHTILDVYESFEHAQLVAQLSDVLSNHLSQMSEDVLLRLGDLNPKLQLTLYSAFKTFYLAQTSEDIPQVALSCRRFLKFLADTLFPPRSEPVKDKPIDDSHYRNRLWAYVEERLGEHEREKKLVLVTLDDLGSRINKIDELAHKGVHNEISLFDLDRLLIALVTFTYDLLSLAPPPTELPIEPYGDEIINLFEEIAKPSQEGRNPL